MVHNCAMARRSNYDVCVAAPFGAVGVQLADDAVVSVDLLPKPVSISHSNPSLARTVRQQLLAYLADPRFVFDLPLRADGTPFQQRVWRALRRIPAGRVMTYGALAHRLDTGPRAIGGACRTNPIPLIIPCHRVVAANGIGGFMGVVRGRQVAFKEWLLSHEHAR